MTFAPGSFAWLLAHDLRLSTRQLVQFMARWSLLKTLAMLVAGFVGMHAFAWGILEMRSTMPGLFTPQAMVTAIVGALLWMIAQGLLGATRSLYERGSLELLLSSPLAQWKTVFSRALSIAVTSAVALSPILLPLANVAAFQDGTTWLAMYPVLASMALVGTAIGLVVAIGLFSAVGARRARQISQFAAAIIAGGFALVIQLGFLLPKATAAQTSAWFASKQLALSATVSQSYVGLDGILRGEVPSLVLVLMAALAIFSVAVAAFSGSFARASQVAAGNSDDGAAGKMQPFKFGPANALRRKEWRLLTRDPNLFAQLGLQIVYTLPLAVILVRSPKEIMPALVVTPLVVVLAAQIAASLAWITVSGEDAPDMIATAPITPNQTGLAKLTAIAAPLGIILLLPMLALMTIAPKAMIYAITFSAAAACSTAVINFWNPMPGNRRSMLRRHSQSKLIAIAEHSLAMLWAVAVVMALVDLRFALVPLAVIGIVMWLLKPKQAAARNDVKKSSVRPRHLIANASNC
ncbi:MAG: hypothetical protein ABL901_16070 [Hyphomicrobiaceae bacterium]